MAGQDDGGIYQTTTKVKQQQKDKKMKYPNFNEAGLNDEQVEAIRECMSQANGSESRISDHDKEIVIYDNGGRELILKVVKPGFQFNVWFRAPNAQKVDKPFKRLKEYLQSKGANDWRFNSAGIELVAQNKAERNGKDRGNVLYFWPQDDSLRARLSWGEIYKRREALGELSKLILEKLKEVNYFTIDYTTLPLSDESGDEDDYDEAEVTDSQKKGKLDSSLVDKVLGLVKNALNVVLTGAPGTGKTYTAREVAKVMVGAMVSKDAPEGEKEKAKKAEEERIASVQFHPGYDYSDFVIGMKPVLIYGGKEVFRDADGLYTKKDESKEEYDKANIAQRLAEGSETKVSYRWKDGIFKKFADKAKGDLDHKYVFLIDEINRADLSRVFGELFSLLEEEYRYPGENATSILLPDGKDFVIPKNLYIIGTMNDIDRSVESMDFALRRRFAWYEVTAESSKHIIRKKVADENAAQKLEAAMDDLNELIAPPLNKKDGSGTENQGTKPSLVLRLGSEYQLGGAIFAKFEKYQSDSDDANDSDAYTKLWYNHIENILSEYLRGRSNRKELVEGLKQVFDDAIKGKPKQTETQAQGSTSSVANGDSSAPSENT